MTANPPTAKSGLRASTSPTEARMAAVEGDKRPAETAETTVGPRHEKEAVPANTTGEPLLNPPQSSEALLLDPATVDVLTGEEAFPFHDLHAEFPQTVDFLREACASYRGMLIGLTARLQNEIDHPQGLNPNTNAARDSLRIVQEGIAKCVRLEAAIEEARS